VLGASGRVGGRKPKTGKHGAQQEQRAEKRRSKDDRRKKRIRKRGG
jgi:hypothetical protein